MTIGDRLAQARAAQKQRQAEFAKEIGVSLRAYTNYENDAADLPLRVIKLICERYDVPIEWLVFGKPRTADPRLVECVKEATTGVVGYMSAKQRFLHSKKAAEVAGLWFTKLAQKETFTKEDQDVFLRLADGESRGC